jgi:predicted nuclease of predicted toxin-antitoxin system
MKPTLVKLDENLGEAHAALLRQAGYGVERVYDEGLSGKSDEIVWERTCAEGRLFITLDMDFADIRRYGTIPHPGVLLIRARTKGQQSVLAVLARVTRESGLDSLRGCLVVADEQHTRIRRPATEGANDG